MLTGWPDCRFVIKPALQRMADGSGGRFLVEDIEAALADGRMQVWCLDSTDAGTPDCVLVTEVVSYPRLRAFRLIGFVGHHPRRWLHWLAWLEDVARRDFKCDRMEAFAPPGDERMLTTGGWTTWHILTEKRL